jgi:phosphatidylserine/phosphatidylglycerophosphate/cardiolipin synthase-like enzyme
VGNTPVEMLFAPHRRRDPHHGLRWLQQRLAVARRQLDLALFVVSSQDLANALAVLHQRGVKIRVRRQSG